MKKIIMMMVGILFLSSCNLAHTLSSGGAAGTGALVCGAIGGPVAGAGCASIATVAIEVLTPIVSDKVTLETVRGEDGDLSITEFAVFAWIKFEQYIWGIGAALLFLFYFTGKIGLRMKRPEEKQLEAQQLKMLEMIAKMKK